MTRASRDRRAYAAALVVAVVMAAIALVAAGAGTSRADGLPSLTIDPTAGPAGTTIGVSGTGCPDASWDGSLTWRVHVQIREPGSTPSPGGVTSASGSPKTVIAFTAEGYPGRADATATPAADGTWSTDITIPGSGPTLALPADYPVSALCYAHEGAEGGTIEYPAATFVVVQVDPPPLPPPPPPPPPVVTNPNFTG